MILTISQPKETGVALGWCKGCNCTIDLLHITLKSKVWCYFCLLSCGCINCFAPSIWKPNAVPAWIWHLPLPWEGNTILIFSLRKQFRIVIYLLCPNFRNIKRVKKIVWPNLDSSTKLIFFFICRCNRSIGPVTWSPNQTPIGYQHQKITHR